MKFQRLACNCCKTGGAAPQCQSPTYVISEVIDDSNVVFLLISNAGRASCGGPLAIDRAGEDAEAFASDEALGESRGFVPNGRAQAIIDSCSHPTFRPAYVWRRVRAKVAGVAGHAARRRGAEIAPGSKGAT